MLKIRKPWLIGVGLLMAVLAVFWLIQVGIVLAGAKRAGLLDDEQTIKYQVSRDNNLKAIHRALMQANESEGHFPSADKWMDIALIRLKTSDITEDEAKGKLRVPGSKEYGYAINSVLAGKALDNARLRGDTVLAFESVDQKWNASGLPEKDAAKGAKGVTLEGKIVGLKDK